jgi:glycosyltransferase involved in cell wall biosynthesis
MGGMYFNGYAEVSLAKTRAEVFMANHVFSVVIPTFNRAYLIERPIRSVLAQTCSSFEIIVVDDNSTDNTEEIVKGIGDSRIKYVRHDQNYGSNVARNTGIENATGEFIAFLDSDDEWLPEKLEKQLKILSNHSEICVCYTWIKSVNEDTKKELIVSPEFEGFIFEDLLYSQFVNPSSTVVRRSCFDTVGVFDVNPAFRSCQDWDLWLRLSQSYQFAMVPEVLTIWWNHSSKNRNTNNVTMMFQGFLALLEKYPEMQNLPNTFKTVGSASLKIKGDYLFERGKRYMLQASEISHLEGIKLGKKYLKMAFLSNPLNLTYFFHYNASSLMSQNYLHFSKVENNLRKTARKALHGLKKFNPIFNYSQRSAESIQT